MSTHIITSRGSSGGTITPLGAQIVTDGASQAFVITASTGYALSELYVDNVLTTNAATYTFTNNLANHLIDAIFALNGGRYSTQANLTQRIGTARLAELTNDTAGATTPDPLVIGAMIDRADRFIDTLAGQVYTVPFVAGSNCTAIPSIITQLSIDLAIYYCFTRRFAQMEIPKDWQESYKQVQEKLTAISNLLVFLDGGPTVVSTEANVQIDNAAPQISFTDINNQTSIY